MKVTRRSREESTKDTSSTAADENDIASNIHTDTDTDGGSISASASTNTMLQQHLQPAGHVPFISALWLSVLLITAIALNVAGLVVQGQGISLCASACPTECELVLI